MRVAKYHGTGNDFVLLEDLEDRHRPSRRLIAALCDRRLGVGGDGLIRITRGAGADFVMDYYNADGGAAEMCGNGIRCLAKYVFDRGLTTKTEIEVDTRAGRRHLAIEARDGVATAVTVDMGRPAFERGAIPMVGDPDSRFVEERLEVEGRRFVATALSMGNPHCVLLLDPAEDLQAIDVPRLGRAVEDRADLFPARTNVEFVQVGEGVVRARVWERGSGETLACGTGACASVVATAASGRIGREADVEFPGGRLQVAWREEDGHVLLTGPAVAVFEAELDPEWLAEAGGEEVR